jgi:hypothetical protein
MASGPSRRRVGKQGTFRATATAASTAAGSQLLTDAAEPGNRWNRWMHPAVPADVPGVPRGYFVEAIKA